MRGVIQIAGTLKNFVLVAGVFFLVIGLTLLLSNFGVAIPIISNIDPYLFTAIFKIQPEILGLVLFVAGIFLIILWKEVLHR